MRLIIFEVTQNIGHFCKQTWHTSLRVHKKVVSSEFIIFFCNRYLKKTLGKNSISFWVMLYLFRFTISSSQLSLSRDQTKQIILISWYDIEVISSFYFKLNHLILSGKPQFFDTKYFNKEPLGTKQRIFFQENSKS